MNILADKALLAAFTEDAPCVEARHVRLAEQECSFVARRRPTRRAAAAALGVVAALLALALAWVPVATWLGGYGTSVFAHWANL